MGKKKKKEASISKRAFLINDLSPFAMLEAYKILRTNVMFSLPEKKCKVIAITSANQGEGKSTTACNLAIAFATNQSKVLLIDCDLRLPSDAAKFEVEEKPGLSNLLIGLSTEEESIRHLGNGVDLLPAGEIPPNPTELLGSEQMTALLASFGERYEYIILDTPPCNIMADAPLLAKNASGTLVVVRQDVATKESVDEALKKLEFAKAKILGFVFTGERSEKMKYYKKNGYHYYS